MITRSVQFDAADPKQGLMLDDLALFVEEARNSDVPGDTVIKVRVNVRGGIKRVETKP
ncbi:hypothetical protein ACWEPL_12370 [Nonomuraea sp. NPDC004186]